MSAALAWIACRLFHEWAWDYRPVDSGRGAISNCPKCHGAEGRIQEGQYT